MYVVPFSANRILSLLQSLCSGTSVNHEVLTYLLLCIKSITWSILTTMCYFLLNGCNYLLLNIYKIISLVHETIFVSLLYDNHHHSIIHIAVTTQTLGHSYGSQHLKAGHDMWVVTLMTSWERLQITSYDWTVSNIQTEADI